MENEKNVIDGVTVIREDCSSDENNDTKCCFTVKKNFFKRGKFEKSDMSSIYGLGVFGALIYFITSASGFGSFFFGIFKAIF